MKDCKNGCIFSFSSTLLKRFSFESAWILHRIFSDEFSLTDTCNQSDTRLHIIKRAENMWLSVYHQTFRGCPLLMNTSSVQQYIPMATETAVCQYFGTISPINVCNHNILNSCFCPFVGRYQGILKNVLLTRNTALYVLIDVKIWFPRHFS